MNPKNTITTNNTPFKQSTTEEFLLYQIETLQSITLMEETTEDTITAEVSKRFIKKDKFGYLYETIVKKRTQNNIEGSRGIGAFLEKLNEQVLVYTNDIGQIISIPNFGEINEVWTDIRYDFRKKFKKNHRDINEMIHRMDVIMSNPKNFLALYRQTEIATLLFPPIYIKDIGNPNFKIFQHKVFPFFFGQNSLPIKVVTSLVNKDMEKEKKILRTGFIDTTIFNQKAVKLLFREYYKSPLMSMDIESDYSEMFYFNKKNTLNTACQILKTAVGEVYQFNQFTNVSLLS